MEVIEFPKNSQEWLDFKLGKNGGSGMKELYPARTITKEVAKEYLEQKGYEIDSKAKASEVLDMLTAEDIGYLKAQGEKKDGYYKLIAQRVARPFTPNDYEDMFEEMFGYRKDGKVTMIDRGHILEPLAIKEFEKRNNVKTDGKSVVWQRTDNQNSILTPDDAITQGEKVKRAVEVKCFDSHRIIRAYDENAYPSECKPQIIKYFINNDYLDVLHFVMYTDLMPSLPYLQFDIWRKDVTTVIAEMKAFEDEILRQADELTERLAF